MADVHARRSSEPQPESLLDTARTVWAEIHLAVHSRLRLASLELRRAGLALVQIVILAALAALLLASSWFMLTLAIYFWGLQMGLHQSLALALAALINVAAASALWWWATQLTQHLMLAATLRGLRRAHAPQPSPATVAPPATAAAPPSPAA